MVRNRAKGHVDKDVARLTTTKYEGFAHQLRELIATSPMTSPNDFTSVLNSEDKVYMVYQFAKWMAIFNGPPN